VYIYNTPLLRLVNEWYTKPYQLLEKSAVNLICLAAAPYYCTSDWLIIMIGPGGLLLP
jgi:hypothetical protein